MGSDYKGVGMAIAALLVLAGVLLAYANGANDNFKGVATLFGSGTTSYRGALAWATATTFAGSVASIFVAHKLVTIFSGTGLVSEAVQQNAAFLPTVACAAGLTVLLATRLGFPISTTHSLLGALLGPALVAGGTAIDLGYLSTKFVVPLLVSPFAAIALSYLLYWSFRSSRTSTGIDSKTNICIGEAERPGIVVNEGGTMAFQSSMALEASLETTESCQSKYSERVRGLNAEKALDVLHFATAGLVSFARGLNDTPKITAVLLAAGVFGAASSGALIAVGMALGGLLSARRVGQVMSKNITPLNHGQGFTANLVTGLLVIVASRYGLPVSTTHVSCGSLFGIGLGTKQANWSTIASIVLAWVITLPVALGLATLMYSILAR